MATPIVLDEYRDKPEKLQAELMMDESTTAIEGLCELLEVAGEEKVDANKISKLMKPHVNNIRAWSSALSRS